jgi:hypothetical protein
MSTAPAPSVDNPRVAGGAGSGAKLLDLAQRFMRTGMAFARRVNGIARERLRGADVAQLAPAGFNATATHYLIVEALAWTAALRQRLRDGLAVVQLPMAAGLPRPDWTPQRRAVATASLLPAACPEAAADPWHDWRELAKPLRIGAGGLAAAARAMDGLSVPEVASNVSDKLQRAAADLGSDADVGRIAAIEAAMRALCAQAEAAAEPPGASVPEAAEEAGSTAPRAGAPGGARAVGPPSDDAPADDAPNEGAPEEWAPEEGADDDPPPEPPDG